MDNALERNTLLDKSKRLLAPVTLATVVVTQLSFLAGVSLGYSSILLAQLKDPSSALHISNDQGSWIASLGTVCRPIGALAEGYLVDKFGRKTTVQITSIFISMAWLLTFFSYNITVLYAARILLSFALGMVICVGLYIVEICKATERGTHLSLITPMTILGTLVVYIIGYLFTWTTVALILCIYCLLIFVASISIPETPIWCLIHGRREEAKNSLMRLRCNPLLVDQELIQSQESLANIHFNNSEGAKGNWFHNFKDPAVYKPFIILIVFSVLQQQVGYNVITSYASSNFFKYFETDFLNASVISILFAGVSVIGSIILMLIVHKYGRKQFVAVSGFGMSLVLVVAALTMRLIAVPGLPLGCLFLYSLFCMLGLIDIPWMIVGEMFPTKARGSMSAAVTVIIFLMQFVTIKTYPTLEQVLGIEGLLLYFSLMCLLSVLFALAYFPETKDKSLFEIEQNFRNGGGRNRNENRGV